MPELPEVETITRELRKKLIGKTISKVEVRHPKTVAPTTPKQFAERIRNQKISNLSRRAKMILIKFDSDLTLVVHLKMTGQLIFVPNHPNRKGKVIRGGHPMDDTQTPGRHTRIIFHLENGTLYFNDLRKFGWVRIQDEKLESHIKNNYGPEPLDKSFSLDIFQKIIRRFPNRTVKKILLDQSLIAGVGNIYADEACHLSQIRPDKIAGRLTGAEIALLYKNIRGVLKLSISKKGTSSKNYRRSDGTVGGFMSYLKVYGRENKKCKTCGTLIKKIKHAGRGTHFCPRCQK